MCVCVCVCVYIICVFFFHTDKFNRNVENNLYDYVDQTFLFDLIPQM